MNAGWLLPIMVLVPGLCAGACFLFRSAGGAIRFCAAGTLLGCAAAVLAAGLALRHGPLFAAGQWFMLDALSAYHVAVMAAVFCLSALHGPGYFRADIARGALTPGQARRYGALWFGAQAAMTLVLVSNNLGVGWVGIEATTLVTAFLICVRASPAALEAMWKYLLMCSVGMALAFTGTLLMAASRGAAPHGTEALLWTHLRANVATLNPVLLKAGFLFLVIGYGTKAGLAPMHNWLPDAHSQAPAPVSAIFSGFMLNAALYCILRCLPLVETVAPGWGRGVLVVFGLLSILVASVFIVAQRDVKRMLAYSSVEHLGIVSLGVGLGGAGCVAALFHMFNHSLCKSVAFCGGGRLGQLCGTQDMRGMARIVRVSPVWGGGLAAALLVLIGTAPFAVFLSEFMILRAAVEARAYRVAALFLVGLGVVFIGVLGHLIAMVWTPKTEGPPAPRTGGWEAALVFGPLAALLVLGVWLPPSFTGLLAQAARMIGGGP